MNIIHKLEKKKFNNIIVTGGAGFIGNHLIKKLSKISKKIFVIDNYSTGYNKSFPKNVVLIKKDCKDKSSLKSLNKYKFDSVVHLAGVSSVEASFDDPVNDANSNIVSTINMLNFVKKKKIRNFVYASSMCVYGKLKQNIAEIQKKEPISFYGLSKITAEKYISFFETSKTSKIILRLFNVYGPGADSKNKKHGMFGIYLEQMLNAKKILVKGSLSRYRDFIYIDDVLSIIIKSMSINDNKSHIYNVCTSKKIVIKNLLNYLSSELKMKKKIISKGNTPGDQFGIYGNNRKIKKKLKIKKFISIKEGIKKIIKTI